MNSVTSQLLSLLGWDTTLPYHVLKFKPTAVYFCDRGVINFPFIKKVHDANRSAFNTPLFFTAGDVRTKDFFQYEFTQDFFDYGNGLPKEILERINYYTPQILHNGAMDWLCYECHFEEEGVLVFRCESNLIEQFLNFLGDEAIFDWDLLQRNLEHRRIGASDYWLSYKQLSLESPKHLNVCALDEEEIQRWNNGRPIFNP